MLLLPHCSVLQQVAQYVESNWPSCFIPKKLQICCQLLGSVVMLHQASKQTQAFGKSVWAKDDMF